MWIFEAAFLLSLEYYVDLVMLKWQMKQVECCLQIIAAILS